MWADGHVVLLRVYQRLVERLLAFAMVRVVRVRMSMMVRLFGREAAVVESR